MPHLRFGVRSEHRIRRKPAAPIRRSFDLRFTPGALGRTSEESVRGYQPPEWYEIRPGGQYVKITGPIRLSLGTAPHVRESQEPPRLSPTMK
jgi:hypothetical protein